MAFKPQKQTPKGSVSIYKDSHRIKFWSWCWRHGVLADKKVAHEARHDRKTFKASNNKIGADFMDFKPQKQPPERSVL